ncbi:hypothetical protein WN51_09140 [Melipona quadrifasciata]|uniref:Uncharacterized protein n=1 Tax=Melipona quadrifasciata TaxID=166423 RepID=A0A0N0BJL9_9HYME|nr:hypothetical protein WN51_09140 [Melipona quadrifasciata]
MNIVRQLLHLGCDSLLNLQFHYKIISEQEKTTLSFSSILAIIHSRSNDQSLRWKSINRKSLSSVSALVSHRFLANDVGQKYSADLEDPADLHQSRKRVFDQRTNDFEKLGRTNDFGKETFDYVARTASIGLKLINSLSKTFGNRELARSLDVSIVPNWALFARAERLKLPGYTQDRRWDSRVRGQPCFHVQKFIQVNNICILLVLVEYECPFDAFFTFLSHTEA